MIFEVLVHDPDEEDWGEHPQSTLTLEEWQNQGAGWRPDFEEVGLRITPNDGPVWQRDGWAPLELLGRMCTAAAQRLDAGKPALLRSVQDDVAAWILLEPQSEEVSLAVLQDVDPLFASRFPIADPPGWPHRDPADLYAYAIRERSRLLTPFSTKVAEQAHLRGCHVGRQPLIAALRHVANLALQIARD